MATFYDLHAVLVPFMAPGHTIPAIEIACLLAEHGVVATVITTPVNAARIAALIDQLKNSSSCSLPVRLIELPFPCAAAGLPEGCENLDLIPELAYFNNFLEASIMFCSEVASYLRSAVPRPSCIISDMFNYWTADVARELRVPRLVFHGQSCFTLLCNRMIQVHEIHERIKDLTEPFVVPGLPYDDVVTTMLEAPGFFDQPGMELARQAAISAELAADGVVLNSFEELEASSIESYKAAMNKHVWAIGPLCLSSSSRSSSNGTVRGNQPSIGEDKCRDWLDMRSPRSVIYVSFGSITYVYPAQHMEIGLALAAANRHPFIWVIKAFEITDELERWLEGFQKRVGDRGLVIKGWAPQAMILSHPAVGGFLTHCGWNSVLEGVSAGLPMITWPHFGDQFLNEKLVVEILKIGTAVGAKPLLSMEALYNVMVPKEDIQKAIESIMGKGEEEEARRERVRLLGAKASKAMEKRGGSSQKDMRRLIDFISQHTKDIVDL